MKISAQDSIAWIKRRRSVFPKMFEPGEVSEQEIKDLLEAARWAPTHKLTQPWRFVVFREAAKMRLAELQCKAIEGNMLPEQLEAKQSKIRLNADQSAAIFAICMKRDEAKRIPEFEEIAAVSSAVQNMWLHAESLGLAGYWSTGSATNHPDVRAELKLSADDLHLGWFYLGKFSGEIVEPKNRLGVEVIAEIRN
ncbi:MAG: nitroreductase [Flavobacteriales bacterium]